MKCPDCKGELEWLGTMVCGELRYYKYRCRKCKALIQTTTHHVLT